MSSYLEAYGAAEQHRARIHRDRQDTPRSSLVGVLVVGLILYGVFKNHAEEQRAKTFRVAGAHNYPAAYAMWGCTDSHPCPEYPFPSFWRTGDPKSAHAKAIWRAVIGLSQSCGSGVVIRLDYKSPEEPVAVVGGARQRDHQLRAVAGVSRPASAFWRVAQVGVWRQLIAFSGTEVTEFTPIPNSRRAHAHQSKDKRGPLTSPC